MAKSTHRKGFAFDGFLVENMKDPEFRQHFEQRRIIQDVALAVREMREAAGLTQAQLAGLIGVKQPMIARVERGSDRRTPSWDVLRRIGRALGRQFVVEFVSAKRAVAMVQVDGRRPGARSGNGRYVESLSGVPDGFRRPEQGTAGERERFAGPRR